MTKYLNNLHCYVLSALIIWHCAVHGLNEISARRKVFVAPMQPKAMYFTGAGIYFWWQAGCARYIQENCDYSEVPMIGASAGSLSSALLLANVDFQKAAESALRIGSESKVYERKGGLAGVWGTLLVAWLNEVIPDDVNADTFKRLQIAVTPYLKSPKLVSGFQTKAEVIDACMASCHVPVFLDGRPTTSFRGEQVLDGSFWYFVTKDRTTGLPIPADKKPDEIFWIDYCDDDDFMQSISGNILELVSPSKLLDMMDDGYNFMKREHFNGRLPLARLKKPNFVYVSDFINSVERLPKKLIGWTDALEIAK
jgi:Patatin-like phospholipase